MAICGYPFLPAQDKIVLKNFITIVDKITKGCLNRAFPENFLFVISKQGEEIIE